jgi:hypothetical protein
LGALAALLAWLLAGALGVSSSLFTTGSCGPLATSTWPGCIAALALAYCLGLGLSLPTLRAPHATSAEPAPAAGRPVGSFLRDGLLRLLLVLPLLVSAAALLYLARVLPWLSLDVDALFRQGLMPLALWLGMVGPSGPGWAAQTNRVELSRAGRVLELVGRVVLASVRREPGRDGWEGV